MADKERDFKGVWIPKEVWLDERLSSLDKVILTEIDSLDNGERGCFASNKHISEFCQCSEAKVTKSIALLIKLGYVNLQHFDGRQRELRSRLIKNTTLPGNFYEADSENVRHSNIDNNTESIRYIVAYLNSKIGASYRASSKDTQKHINARLNEGYTIDDFKTVIDKQYAKWKGTEYEQYLRPSTLFGTKFENYLNAKATSQQESSDSGKGWNGTSGRTDF